MNKKKKNRPTLRFPLFNGDWEEKTLGECLDYEQPTKYLVNSTRYDDKYKTPVLTAGKTFILGYTDEKEGIFSKNVPVIIFDDFTTASKFVDFPFKAKSSAMKILLAKKGNDTKFLFEAMQNVKFQVGTHQRHWISIYSKLNILIPKDYKEQQKIAACLSSLDDLIVAHQEKLSNLKDHKKGLLQNLFPKAGEKVPRLRFDGFEGEWEETTLGEVVIYKNGKSYENDICENGIINLITLNSINIDGSLSKEHKKVNLKADLKKDDIIIILSDIAHGYFLGLSAVIPENDKFTLNQRVGLLRKKIIINSYFLSTTINFNQSYFKRKGQGSSQQNLNKGDVLSFSFYLPCIKEQQKIAACLSSLDDLIAAHQEKLTNLKAHKKGLLQRMFI